MSNSLTFYSGVCFQFHTGHNTAPANSKETSNYSAVTSINCTWMKTTCFTNSSLKRNHLIVQPRPNISMWWCVNVIQLCNLCGQNMFALIIETQIYLYLVIPQRWVDSYRRGLGMRPSGAGQSFLQSVPKKKTKQQNETFMGEFLQQEIPEHRGRGVQREELWYLFFSNAVEGELLLHPVASVDHQTGVCRAEGSEAGRWAVILQHKKVEKKY